MLLKFPILLLHANFIINDKNDSNFWLKKKLPQYYMQYPIFYLCKVSQLNLNSANAAEFDLGRVLKP